MATDLIRYDLLTQDAMRQVVRHVMGLVAREGRLPGDHHFYISFFTPYQGVRLSPQLREQYPDEMTIILQHQFENLVVTDAAFEVTLQFAGKAERLVVPFDAITQFFDRSVNFGLKFELAARDEQEGAAAPAAPPQASPKAKSAPKGAGSEPQSLTPRAGTKDSEPAAKPDAGEGGAGKSAEVVSLDKFRKK